MSNIHLIYPDVNTGYYPTANHGIAYLVGALRNYGHSVSFQHITSLENGEDVAQNALGNFPDVIGFSLCHNQAHLAKRYIDAIRKKKAGAFIIAGGIYPTTEPEDALKQLDIDAVAVGEAEYTLLDLVHSIFTNKKDYHQKQGFYFKLSDGRIVKNDIPPLNADLTNLSLPDYSVFNMDKIIKDSAGWMTMMLLRGCPFNCNYCCNSVLMNIYPVRKDYFRIPPVDHAITLIKHNLRYATNIKGIAFDDDLLCLNKQWYMAFSKAYKHEIGLPYTMNTRVESLDDDIINAMKESGCRIVNIGVESGNKWVRENILNRHYTNEQLIEAFSKLNKVGILTSSFNMMGLPFETKDQMRDTLKINKKLRPYRGACFYFYPYPRTKLYEICKQFNLLKKDSLSLTGYFSTTAILQTHCKESDVRRICESLRLYLYLSRFLNNLKLKRILPIMYYSLKPFAGVISRILTSDSKLKSRLRSFIYRTVPGCGPGNKKVK